MTVEEIGAIITIPHLTEDAWKLFGLNIKCTF